MAKEIGAQLLEQGFCKIPVEDQDALEWISEKVRGLTAEFLGLAEPPPAQEFFDQIHDYVEISQLNSLRLHIIQNLTVSEEFRHKYFALAAGAIENLIGNELAMQKGMGFSIQLPEDTTSLLAPHSDVWGSECSPFEAVVWVPLVDCFRTKGVFILPPEKDAYWKKNLHTVKSMDDLFEHIEDDVIWADVKYGEVLIFTPTILHGNRKNEETETRWSFNIRFKGLFTPYAGKGLGEYFQPLQIRPLTKIGMDFVFPTIPEGQGT